MPAPRPCIIKSMKSTKNIVIFGSAGRVGSLVTEYALADGHTVTAFVHRHHNLPEHQNLTLVQGDIYTSADVEKALKGTDVVLSILSSWGTPKKDVLSAAMANIIPAMKAQKISRIISLTGAEARAAGDALSIIHRLAHIGIGIGIGIVGGKVLRDGEKHIELLASSGLDWTVVRSPIMRSGTSQKYRLNKHRPLPWALINREAVARAIADQIADKHDNGALFIH